VGKSTLFNRLVGSRKAIVEDIPGITRDRLCGRATFDDVEFELVDTGGFDPNPDDPLLQIMKQQVELALEDADAILFIMDVRSGLNPVDEEIARMLSRWRKPVHHVVNKVDSPEKEGEAYEFYQLGVEQLHLVSATHGRGVNGLLARLAADLSGIPEPAPPPTEVPHVAVVGRPNVGKSTLINRLLGEERLLTSDLPGTTRDSVDTVWRTPQGEDLVLVDTAGMRRKRSIRDSVEYYSVIRAIRSIERSHVVVLLLDARVGMEDQDARIANLVQDRGRGLIIAFNKWDLIQKEPDTADRFIKSQRVRYPTLAHFPILFTSAASGRGVNRLAPRIKEVKASWEKRVPTGEINRFMERITSRTPPPVHGRRRGKVLYATQAEVAPPTFVLHVNHPGAFSDNYRRFITNQIRQEYKFTGSPLRVLFRRRQSSPER